jgi:catechol 2,3-dioxygenase-like lactoylglutathione lyase family enzyme
MTGPEESSHLRIARPSRDLDRAERFWTQGLGLEVLFRKNADEEGGHALLMLSSATAPGRNHSTG